MSQANGSGRVVRAATALIVAHVVLFLCFAAGGVLSLYAFAKNSDNSVNCFGGTSGCGVHHSYAPGIILLVVGFVGNLVVIAIGARIAIGVGASAFSYFRRRQLQ